MSETYDYCTVPAGKYRCRIVEVRPGITRAGDGRWALHLFVSEGPDTGAPAAWDSIVFSHHGRARARHIFEALGLPTKGKVQVDPEELEGLEAFVEVVCSEFATPNGDVLRRNEVTYSGWSSV